MREPHRLQTDSISIAGRGSAFEATSGVGRVFQPDQLDLDDLAVLIQKLFISTAEAPVVLESRPNQHLPPGNRVTHVVGVRRTE